jgi:hypothetical protein
MLEGYVNQFRKGCQEVIAGIIGGIVFSAILAAFVQDGVIPTGIVLLFTLVGILGTVLTIKSYRKSGFMFALGWIAGAWLLKDAMDMTAFLIYFIIPAAVIVVRIAIFLRNQFES